MEKIPLDPKPKPNPDPLQGNFSGVFSFLTPAYILYLQIVV